MKRSTGAQAEAMNLPCLTAAGLADCSGVRHGFFTRQGGVSGGIYGSLNCGLGSGDVPEQVASNRARVCAYLETPCTSLASVRQVHGNRVHTVMTVEDIGARPEADALVTSAPGVVLSILSADCAPILLADPQAGVIGAAHAGWRGALYGVCESVVEGMRKEGAHAENIRAAIGPCISQAAYEVSAELAVEFAAADPNSQQYFAAGRDESRRQFALGPYVRSRLIRSGVGSVHLGDICTYANEEHFFSYRRATHRREPDYGRAISAIVLRPPDA